MTVILDVVMSRQCLCLFVLYCCMQPYYHAWEEDSLPHGRRRCLTASLPGECRRRLCPTHGMEEENLTAVAGALSAPSLLHTHMPASPTACLSCLCSVWRRRGGRNIISVMEVVWRRRHASASSLYLLTAGGSGDHVSLPSDVEEEGVLGTSLSSVPTIPSGVGNLSHCMGGEGSILLFDKW